MGSSSYLAAVFLGKLNKLLEVKFSSPAGELTSTPYTVVLSFRTHAKHLNDPEALNKW